MKLSRFLSTLLLTAAPLAAAHAALPRFPQPFGDRIVFVADGNVWSVGKAGGEAVRLTSAAGQDMFPRASPDGRWIAYTEASRSGTDVWVIPGLGRRGAAADLSSDHGSGHRRAARAGQHGGDLDAGFPGRGLPLQGRPVEQLDPVHVQGPRDMGGAPVAMPIDSMVGLATFAPDGHTIAYNRIFRNFRTWKRYNGGLAQQVFTYDFNTKDDKSDHELVGHQHLAHVVRQARSTTCRTRTRASPRQHLGATTRSTKQSSRGDPLHRLRHRLPGARRRRYRLPSRAASSIASTCPPKQLQRGAGLSCRTTIPAPASRMWTT